MAGLWCLEVWQFERKKLQLIKGHDEMMRFFKTFWEGVNQIKN